MNIDSKDCYDRFEALGLHRYRGNASWIEQPVYGRTIPDVIKTVAADTTPQKHSVVQHFLHSLKKLFGRGL